LFALANIQSNLVVFVATQINLIYFMNFKTNFCDKNDTFGGKILTVRFAIPGSPASCKTTTNESGSPCLNTWSSPLHKLDKRRRRRQVSCSFCSVIL